MKQRHNKVYVLSFSHFQVLICIFIPVHLHWLAKGMKNNKRCCLNAQEIRKKSWVLLRVSRLEQQSKTGARQSWGKPRRWSSFELKQHFIHRNAGGSDRTQRNKNKGGSKPTWHSRLTFRNEPRNKANLKAWNNYVLNWIFFKQHCYSSETDSGNLITVRTFDLQQIDAILHSKSCCQAEKEPVIQLWKILNKANLHFPLKGCWVVIQQTDVGNSAST